MTSIKRKYRERPGNDNDGKPKDDEALEVHESRKTKE